MNTLLVLSLVSTLFSFSSTACDTSAPVAGASASLRPSPEHQVDRRIIQLQSFLAKQGSPLEPHAGDFVSAADRYGLDWKLLPAIAGVESTFGKHIPYGSFNAYGWANGAYRFTSWEDSISHVSRALKEKYVDRGLDTPHKIGPVYAPPSTTWAGKVIFFMNQIENFASVSSAASPDLTI